MVPKPAQEGGSSLILAIPPPPCAHTHTHTTARACVVGAPGERDACKPNRTSIFAW